jgi:hypothetical protein
VASGRVRFRPCRVYATAIPHRPKPAKAALMELDGSPRSHEPLAPLGVLRFSSGRSGSGSFGLPRVPRGLSTVAGAGLQGFPVTSTVLGRSLGATAFMALSSPSERSQERWNLLSAVPPLMGFGVSLPPVYLPRVHSREPRPPSDRRCHTPVHVPPSWFHTTTTVSSARELRVCCTPQPAKGSPRFMHAATAPPEGGRATGTIPATRFTPFEEFPSSAAVPHHCGRCLPAVTVLPGVASDMSR